MNPHWISRTTLALLLVAAGSIRAELFVGSFNGNRVQRHSETNGATLGGGAFVVTASGGLVQPEGMAVGPDGNLYVASAGNDSVLRYNGTNGSFIDAFISSTNGVLDYPVSLEFRPDGFLYVSSQLNNAVVRFNATNGAFAGGFVTNGSGGLQGPSGMAWGLDGHLYVAGRFGNHVLKYDGTNGAFLGTFVQAGGPLAQPFGIQFGPDGHLYVANGNSNAIARFNAITGAWMGNFIAAGSGGLSLPMGLAFGPNGDLYVASFSNNKVARYNGGTGAYVADFVAAGAGGLAGPNFLLFRAARTYSTNIPGIGPVGPIEQRHLGLMLTEGPAADTNGNVYFSDVNGACIYKSDTRGLLSAFFPNNSACNGLMFDQTGRLLACQRDQRRILAIDIATTNVTPLATGFAGSPFIGPNDLVIDSAGGVYFTDPDYTVSQTDLSQSVYYSSAAGVVSRIASKLARPNGVILSPDERTLYVVSSGVPRLMSYPVLAPGVVGPPVTDAIPQTGDGMTIDTEGNLYLCQKPVNQILVRSPAGVALGSITFPETPANCTFGGKDMRTLFVTAQTSVYVCRMSATGHRFGRNLAPIPNATPGIGFGANPVTVTMTPVNDAPTFTLTGTAISVLENSGPFTQTGFASSILAGPPDEIAAGQTVRFILHRDNDSLFSALPTMDAGGTLTFAPAANATGTATVTVVAQDNGGRANGGIDNSADQTFIITITPCVTVANANDAGDGSLRQAINDIRPGGTVTFDPALDGTTIVLRSGPLVVDKNLNLLGQGPAKTVVARSAASDTPAFRMVVINSNIAVSLSGMTFTNGRVESGSGSVPGDGNGNGNGNGNGINNEARGAGVCNMGALVLSNCVVSGNTARAAEPSGGGGSAAYEAAGGGIYNAPGGSLTLIDCTVSDNVAVATVDNPGSDTTCSARGGGIASHAANLLIIGSTLSGNIAGATNGATVTACGGGIALAGSSVVQILNSTLSGNAAVAESQSGQPAQADGGGIWNQDSNVGLVSATVASNRVAALSQNQRCSGGGLFNGAETFLLFNTIVAGNSAATGADVLGGFRSDGGNLIGETNGGTGFAAGDLLNTNALLGPLLNNGGPTLTHALLDGSPALNAGDKENPPATDQRGRGYPRVVAGRVDIGAFELQSAPRILACADDITTTNDSGLCSGMAAFAIVATGLPEPEILCTLDGLAITSPHAFPVGVSVVSCTASNFAGTARCSFAVHVSDAEAPVIHCPTNLAITAAPGATNAAVPYAVSAMDNCGVASTNCRPASGSSFPLGVTTVRCTATDGNGNTSKCTFNVEVLDGGPASLVNWKFDETSGLLALDSSGNTNLGVLFNGPLRTNGVVGGALRSDGSKSRVSATNPTSLNVIGAFTVACWARPESVSGSRYLVVKGNDSGSQFAYALRSSSAKVQYSWVSPIGTKSTYTTTTNVLSAGRWTHVAVAHAPGSLPTIFINGLSVPGSLSGTATALIQPSIFPFTVGASADGLGMFKGAIDEVVVCPTALVAGQIRNLTNGLPPGSPPAPPVPGVVAINPPTNGCLALWKFDETGGTTAFDGSSNSTHGLLLNNPTRTNGRIGGALRFDGVDDRVVATNSSALNVTGALTVAAWVQPGSVGGTSMLLIKGSQSSAAYSYALRLSSAKLQYRWVSPDGNENKFATSAIVLTNGQWTHVAAVHTPGRLPVIYINGRIARSSLTSGSATAPRATSAIPFTVGSSSDGSYQFLGAIDEVAVCGDALTPAAIQALMTGTLLASPAPLPSAGLLPASVESAVPTRVELHVTGDAATLSWVSTPGQTYRVQFKNQLGDGAWQDLAVNILARGEITRFENSLDRQPRRFYRVVTQP